MAPRRVVPSMVRDALWEIGEHAARKGGIAKELSVRSHATAILREAVRVAGEGRWRIEEEAGATGGGAFKRPDWRAVDAGSEAVHFYADHKTLQCSDAAFGWSRYSAKANDYLLLSPGVRLLMTEAVEFVVLKKKGQRSSPSEVRRARLAAAWLQRRPSFPGPDGPGCTVPDPCRRRAPSLPAAPPRRA